jgi:hypothetical protein
MTRCSPVPCAIALMACAAVSPAAAQSASSDSLRNFVETILSDFLVADGRPTIRMSELPEILSDLPLPDGTAVLGSLEYASFSMSLVRADNPSEALWAMRRRLEESGWAYKPVDVPAGLSFSPAPTSALLCAENRALSLAVSDAEYIFVVHATNPLLVAQCKEAPARGPNGMPESPIPQVQSPPGALSMGSGGSGGGSNWSSYSNLQTEWSVRQIMDHYAWELQRAGVRIGEVTVTEVVAWAPLTIMDSKGTEWRGAITVSVAATNHRTVHVQVAQ